MMTEYTTLVDVDWEELLTPITPEYPAGESLRYEGTYDRIQEALSARAQPPQMAPTYIVRPPIPSSAGRQRIQVLLQGSSMPVGSVDIQSTRTGQAEIINLNVLQEHRRRGVARLLIDAALQNAQRQGLTGARLEARPSDSSISLSSLVTMYQKMGFRGTGVSSRGNPVLERRTGPV